MKTVGNGVRATFFSFIILHLAVAVGGQEALDARGGLARSLLPAAAREDARVIVSDAGGERVVREGGGFLCISDGSRPGRLRLNCHHESLQQAIALEHEVAAQGLRGTEFGKRFCETAESRPVRLPSGVLELSASLSIEPDGTLPRTMTVYHLLWMPGATSDSAGFVDVDPGDGSPWLHMAGTCQAHLMWSEKRAVQAK